MPEGDFGFNPKLPEEIRDIFMYLCQDLASLQSKWDFYKELYSSEESTRLLSELAQASFSLIEESLRNDMTMSICRLSDPPRSYGKENLSLQTLVQRAPDIQGLSKLLTSFLDACEPVRKYRNTKVSHNDLNTTIKPRENPLPGIGKKEIDTIVQRADQILNAIYMPFAKGKLTFHIIRPGDADTLIFWLKLASDHRDDDL